MVVKLLAKANDRDAAKVRAKISGRVGEVIRHTSCQTTGLREVSLGAGLYAFWRCGSIKNCSNGWDEQPCVAWQCTFSVKQGRLHPRPLEGPSVADQPDLAAGLFQSFSRLMKCSSVRNAGLKVASGMPLGAPVEAQTCILMKGTPVCCHAIQRKIVGFWHVADEPPCQNLAHGATRECIMTNDGCAV